MSSGGRRASLSRPLSSALEDIEGERAIDALTTLLAAWRVTPAPALADAIDVLGARIALPPIGRTDAAWLEIAKRAHLADVTALASRLQKGTLQARADRLAVLLQRPLGDPRLTKPLLSIVTGFESLATNLATFAIWGRIFDAFASQEDVRVREPLLALQKKLPKEDTTRFDRMFAGGVARVLDALPDEAPLLSEEENEAIDVLVSAIRAATASSWDLTTTHAEHAATAASTENDLLEAIYAEPEEDAPRHVYADWLLEKNDPRGAFIALQLRKDSPFGMFVGRDAEQIRLLGLYMRVWLGPALPLIVNGTARFTRGFLSSATLRFPDDAPPEKHARLGALPIWRTLETATGTVLPLLIPENRSLRSVSMSLRTFREVLELEHPTHLTKIVLEGMGPNEAPLGLVKSLPALRKITIESVLDFTQARMRWFLEHSLSRQLEELHLVHTSFSEPSIVVGDWMRVFAERTTLHEMRLWRYRMAVPRFTLRRRPPAAASEVTLEIELVKGTNERLLMQQLESAVALSQEKQKWTLVVIPSTDAQKTHSALHKRMTRRFPSFVHAPLSEPR